MEHLTYIEECDVRVLTVIAAGGDEAEKEEEEALPSSPPTVGECGTYLFSDRKRSSIWGEVRGLKFGSDGGGRNRGRGLARGDGILPRHLFPFLLLLARDPAISIAVLVGEGKDPLLHR